MANKSNKQDENARKAFSSAQKGAMENYDLTAFQDFRNRWDDGTLTDDHVVVVKTTKWAKIVAYRLNCPERADDLRQHALIHLAASSYKGEVTLDAYIKLILLNTGTAKWRKSRGKRRGEFLEGRVDVEEYLRVAAQIRQELTGRRHSNSTELAAEDRQR